MEKIVPANKAMIDGKVVIIYEDKNEFNQHIYVYQVDGKVLCKGGMNECWNKFADHLGKDKVRFADFHVTSLNAEN